MSDPWLALVTNHSIELIGLLDLEGRMVHASPSCATFMGHEPSFELRAVHPDDVERSREWWSHVVAGGTNRLTYRLRRHDGEWRWFDASGIVVPYEGKPHVLISSRDVTAQIRASEERTLLRTLLDHANDAIEVIDPETGRFLDVNEAACLAHGYTRNEYLELRVSDVDPIVAKRPWAEVRDEGSRLGPRVFESQHRRKDGSTFPVEINLTFIERERPYCLAIVRDITERKRAERDLRRMEDQFRHAQKMEAVGRLAGGVAHDFNNLLTVIQGNSELAIEQLGSSHPMSPLLGEVREAAARAAELTHHLLAFCRKQVLTPRVVDLDRLLRDLLQLLRRVIGEDVEVVLIRADRPAAVLVDPGQFEHAILNLAVNARDAMPDGGTLTIETRVTDGESVSVVVSDTGHGMDEATRSRIFEPFFTTKEAGRGTGLGLAMVHGFVAQSGGRIDVQSETGRGTTFTIELPRTTATATAERATVRDEDPGSETILLVEDEDAVRNLSKRILVGNGYVVLDAPDGARALWLAREYRANIDILVTDVVMPGMTGPEVADALASERPGMRILLMSGYSELPLEDAGVAFLQKPFRPRELARKVREVLDRAP
jgi:two-component system, cell cycle sensor histidine kinase and response regulator CckA